jgi:hypothetical protein
MGKPLYTGNMDLVIEFNPAAFKHGMSEADIRKAFDTARYDGLLTRNNMARVTDEEADRLDEKWTKNPPKPGPNGTGFYTRRKAGLTAQAAELDTETRTIVDKFTADYLTTKASAAHKTPADIINEMVRERIAAST